MMDRVDKLQMENQKLQKKLEFERTKAGSQRKRSLGSEAAMDKPALASSPLTEAA